MAWHSPCNPERQDAHRVAHARNKAAAGEGSPAPRRQPARPGPGLTVQVVAVGASAGGIEAFRLFFTAMPADSGMGFVVVLHLSADRRSMLPEIVARWTAMRVSEAANGDRVEPNQVHVIPPGHVATLHQGRLHLRALAPGIPREATPIDEFFDSLAVDKRENAVGIVLSGTGHDGALGLKAIKAAGGMTLAQGSDGTAPQHDGMPSSAIATGAVDLIVPVQDMPRVLLAAQAAQGTATGTPPADEATDADRLRICGILHARLGHDFSQYKDKTFLRRVQRRMQVLGVPSLPGYVDRLDADRGEAVLLFRDLLIGVTTFFRDAAAFEAVQRVVIPRLFANKGANDAVRVWVPGCATGEEAYSLAILLREHMDGLRDVRPGCSCSPPTSTSRPSAPPASGRYPSSPCWTACRWNASERFFSPQPRTATWSTKRDPRPLHLLGPQPGA